MASRGLLKLQQCARPVPLQPWKRFALVGGATLAGVGATAGALVALHQFRQKNPESWLNRPTPDGPLFFSWIGAEDKDNDKSNSGGSSSLRPAKEQRRLMRNSLAEDVTMSALMLAGLGGVIYNWRRPALYNSRCQYAFSRAYFGIVGTTVTLTVHNIYNHKYPTFVAADNHLKAEQNCLRLLQSAPAIGYVGNDVHKNDQPNTVDSTSVESSVKSVVDASVPVSTSTSTSGSNDVIEEVIQLSATKTD